MEESQPLHTILYLSTAVVKFTPGMLEELLQLSRARNAAHGVTGLLLYRDGCFMQLIQGPAEAVRSLYASIQRDPRHGEITTLQDEPCSQTDFPDWSMGFRDLRSAEVRNFPGFSEFLDTPLTSEELGDNVSSARRILMAFKEDV
jgi:hypothetical protein